ALYPAIFMIVTDIAALLYVAYVNLFKKLPAAETAQATVAASLIGIICVVLVVAALILVWDGIQALQQARRAKPAEV
ncbi:MAG: hypothetical protein MUP44_10950, partial [Anaerolineales bacterium]|nr:hypothetical protein [Anaerolineales bacterium]